jgi:hypothetical protein
MSRRMALMVALTLVCLPIGLYAAVTIDRLNIPGGRVIVLGNLLASATAATDGEWVAIDGVRPFSVEITGITVATVQLRGSSASPCPANSSHGLQLGSDVTTDTLVQVDVNVRCLKARISSYTSGTITARLVGEQRS